MITSLEGGLECRTVGSRGSFGLRVVKGYVVGMPILQFHCASISASRGYIILYSKLKLGQILIRIVFFLLHAQVQAKWCKFQVNAVKQSLNDWFLRC